MLAFFIDFSTLGDIIRKIGNLTHYKPNEKMFLMCSILFPWDIT